jgi:CelD/BcsL family acetyltransferase involved in cellulose biosynthesis
MTSLEALPASMRLADRASAAAEGWRIETASDLNAVSRAWLSLEISGLATPYQTLGWQRAAFSTLHAGDRPLIGSAKDAAGRTLLLLPLVLSRRAGVTIARFPAGKHANANMPLIAEDYAKAIDAAALGSMLSQVAQDCGIDLFDLRNQPFTWNGHDNPLALLPHRRAASSAWRADLMADGDAFIASLMSSESRKKLRHKERKLAELGPVRFAEASTHAETQTVLEEFLRQKAVRFAALGLANPFVEPAVLAFLRAAAVDPLRDGPLAPVSLFSMMAGERILAVFGGVIHAGRFSGMFTSFDADPAVSKFSPGDILLLNLLKTMCARGLTRFDLGAGDAAYKTDYCRIEEPLFDSLLPMTWRGRAASLAFATAGAAKRMAKRHPALAAPALKLIGFRR